MAQWISVEEKLPTDNEYYLISDGNLMHVATYEGGNSRGYRGHYWDNGDIFVKPTHWMKLPEFPK